MLVIIRLRGTLRRDCAGTSGSGVVLAVSKASCFVILKKPPVGGFVYFSSASGTTDTVLRSRNPRLNFTVPAVLANKV